MRQFLKVKPTNLGYHRLISTKTWPRQIFSAIQPTGDVHLGNYLGAIKNWVKLQNEEQNKVIYSIADLHAITLPKDPEELHSNILKMAATILACGIDSNKTIFFQQSVIPQHSELSWILGTMTTIPTLNNLPQFKEKSELVKDVNSGIFLYPILQSADVMLYKATHIPVGEDQVQQLQLTMHLSKVFNNKYGKTFPVCEIIVDNSSSRIKSLTTPNKKMSKSEKNTKSAIYISDDPDTIISKLKKAVTDSEPGVTYNPKDRPGVSNLIEIHSAFTGNSVHDVVEESINMTVGTYKMLLARVIIENLKPIREKLLYYLNNKDYLIKELEKGAEKAQERAVETMKEVKEKMGFSLYNLRCDQKTIDKTNDSHTNVKRRAGSV